MTYDLDVKAKNSVHLAKQIISLFSFFPASLTRTETFKSLEINFLTEINRS